MCWALSFHIPRIKKVNWPRRSPALKALRSKLAVLKTPCGHKIELLEYLAPADRKRANLRPCDVGSVHVALLVEDLDAALDRIAVSGWKTAGQPQILTKGPNAGKRVVYVRDPDGTTIEFMQVRELHDGRNSALDVGR